MFKSLVTFEIIELVPSKAIPKSLDEPTCK